MTPKTLGTEPYAPEFVRRLQAGGRFYYDSRDSVPYYAPSVTTIIDAIEPKGYGFHQWLRNYGHYSDFFKWSKAHRGTVVHEIAEPLIKGKTIDMPYIHGVINKHCNILDYMVLGGWTEYELSVRRYLESLMAFWDDYKPVTLSTEEMLYMNGVPFAGQADAVLGMKINGRKKRVLIDFKTGTEQEHHVIQVTAYKKLWNLIHPDEKVSAIGILYLKEAYRTKPNYKFKLVRPQLKRWNSVLGLYLDKHSRNGVIRPRIKPKPREIFKLGE